MLEEEVHRAGGQLKYIAVYLSIVNKLTFVCASESRKTKKHLLVNQALAGKQRLMPFLIRTEDLILAIKSAGVRSGSNGFYKDKSDKFLAETEEGLLVHRTDTFDTINIGCEKFPCRGSFSLGMCGVL